MVFEGFGVHTGADGLAEMFRQFLHEAVKTDAAFNLYTMFKSFANLRVRRAA